MRRRGVGWFRALRCVRPWQRRSAVLRCVRPPPQLARSLRAGPHLIRLSDSLRVPAEDTPVHPLATRDKQWGAEGLQRELEKREAGLSGDREETTTKKKRKKKRRGCRFVGLEIDELKAQEQPHQRRLPQRASSSSLHLLLSSASCTSAVACVAPLHSPPRGCSAQGW